MKKGSLKRVVALAICALILISLLPILAADGFPFVGYTVNSLQLLKSPTDGAEAILEIRKGEPMEVSGEAQGYYQVSYLGNQGYVLKGLVTSLAPGQIAQQAPETTEAPAPVDPALALRYPELQTGDEGVKVRALQSALKELKFYAGNIDGKYGQGTKNAVQAYQKINKLPETGIADSESQRKLFEGRPKNSAGTETRVRTLPDVPDLVLRPGDQGEQVSDLQRLLKDQGYYKGKVDGMYGSGTEKAVRDFQRANGLRVDGKAGQDTKRKLSPEEITAAPTLVPATQPMVTQAPPFESSQTEAPATYPYTTTVLAAVNLRKAASVNSMRYLTVPTNGSITVISSSGDWLKASYKDYTGYLMAEYVSIPEQYLEGKTLPMDTQARVNYEPLSVGASGDKVRALQQALAELGYYKGAVDSRFGAGTMSAVKALQEKNKLRPTGVALPELQQLIYEKRPRNARGLLVNLKLLPPIPGYPMQVGDMGDQVAALHQALTQLGHFKDRPGDTYTTKTAAAVRAFQKAHQIKQTGKVDSFTLLAIDTAMGGGLKQTDAPVVDPGPLPTALTAQNVKVLEQGSRGAEVADLQQKLQTLGYYQDKIDGIFGKNLLAAVKAFQIKNQLLVNGKADLDTQLRLQSGTALSADPVVTPPEIGAQTLKIGASGDAVFALQSRLVVLNYLAGKADGIFGTQTAAAVTTFQRKNGLRPDGIAGQRTLTLLYGAEAIANASAAANPSKEEDSQAVQTTLRLGDQGSQVKAMQQRLINLKYLTGGADGIFGPKSFLALQAFQRSNRLQPDGVAGKLTLNKLSDPAAIAATGMTDVAPTPTPAPVQQAPRAFTPPRAAEVRYGDWYKVIRSRIKSMPNVIIYDFMSGAHYNIKVFSVGRHADGEPPTTEDTRIMEKALGYNNWDPRPVWVIFSDGKVYMASTHSHGHEVDHTPDNGLAGHICIHFPRDMEDAAATGPYAVAHQNAILAGWDLTQSMAR